MGTETERKFLVDHDAWARAAKPTGMMIRQGYIVREPAKTVRIRLRDDEAYITIKGKPQGISHSEHEYRIPPEDGNELLAGLCDAVMDKTRYCINYKGKLWEVDVFAGDNEGLIIAEIELDDEHESFEKPEWVSVEVSMDERYYNSNLSVKPYKNWP